MDRGNYDMVVQAYTCIQDGSRRQPNSLFYNCSPDVFIHMVASNHCLYTKADSTMLISGPDVRMHIGFII